MEDRLQHQPTALEPQWPYTHRVRSTPQSGAKLEQTLLMNEGNWGSRSIPSRSTSSGKAYIHKPARSLSSDHSRSFSCGIIPPASVMAPFCDDGSAMASLILPSMKSI